MRISLSQSIVCALFASTSLLSVFSSTAQAYWQPTPEYTVANRTPLDTPDGAGPFSIHDPYGYNYGEDLTDTPTNGTITAKFTWVHDVPNDTPPADVYVLQQSNASWNIYNMWARSGKARPSVQEATFVHNRARNKGRVRLVSQDDPSPGMADNGLGDAQVVVDDGPEGMHGRSSGYKVVLCHPATDGTLTTPALTISADVTAGEDMKCYSGFDYSAQIIDLKITRNGSDVTFPNKPEQNVMVGERNNMAVSISALPAEIPPVTYQWSIPGGKVKGFADTPSTPGNPTAVPPVPPTPHTGKKITLPAADLQQSGLFFYWYNGTETGDSREVSVVVTIDGKPITVKAKLKVFCPHVGSFTGEYNKAESDLVRYTYDNYIRFSEFNSGIKFSAGVSVPNFPTASGQVAFEQKVSGGRSFKSEVGGVTKYTHRLYSNALDSADEDPLYHREEGGIAVASDAKAILPNTSISIYTSDQPASKILSVDKGININESFFMYLMYKPSTPDSIWVGVSKVDWSWGVEAANTATPWPVNNYFPKVIGTVRPTDATGVDYFDIPEWDTHTQEIPITEYTPATPW